MSNAHPQENRVSCYYVDFQDEQYIVPIHHTEKYEDDIKMIETEQTIFVQDLKTILSQYIGVR